MKAFKNIKPKAAKDINMKKPLFLFAAVLLLSFTGDTGRAVYQVPRLLQSIASADLDLDGDMDIITGHNVSSSTIWGGVYILENQGAGTFPSKDSVFLHEYQSTMVVESLSPGTPPSIIARHSENDTLYTVVLNNVSSTYSIDMYPMQYGNYDFTTGNMNDDTLPDLVFITYENNFLGTMINNGTGKFNEPQYFNTIDFEPLTINCADFDNNGLDDVVLTGVYAEVYFNYGDHFEKLELENGTGRTNTHIVDFDGDNDFDIVAYTCFLGYSFVSVQENIDGLSFELREVFNFEVLTDEFSLCDFNNDNLPDMLFHNIDNSGFYVYINKGDFEFSNGSFFEMNGGIYSATQISCADFDNNGFKDIAFTENTGALHPCFVNIFFNNGMGGFSEDPITTIPETKSNKSSPYQLTCYPNPVKTHSTFSFKQPDYSKSSIHLTDLRGNLVVALEPIQDGDGNVVLDISQHRLKHGLYIASLFVDNQMVESIKIVVE